MALTNKAIENAKSREKAYKLADGEGIYLYVTAKGQRYWRLDYRFEGKRKTLALGVYPDVGLKKARDRRKAARELPADGVDPSTQKRIKTLSEGGRESFEFVAREWYAKFSPGWSEVYAGKIKDRLTKDAYPYIGKRPVNDLTAPEILQILRRVENRGALETAHRIRQ